MSAQTAASLTNRHMSRDELLQRVIAEVDAESVTSALTMRQLAQRLGTTHQRLLYHFGSWDGLLAATLNAQRETDHSRLWEVARQDPRWSLIETIWSRYTRPSFERRARSFFYIAGQALQEPTLYAEFLQGLDDLVEMVRTAGEREGLDPNRARVEAVLVVSLLRGLLLHIHATDDAPTGPAVIARLHDLLAQPR